MKDKDDSWREDLYIRIKARESSKVIDEQYSQYYKELGEIMRKHREKHENSVENIFVIIGLSAAFLTFLLIVGVLFSQIIK